MLTRVEGGRKNRKMSFMGGSLFPVPPSFFFRPTVGIEQLGRASKLRTDADVSERVVVGVAAPRRPSASLLLVNRRATAALLLGAKTFFLSLGVSVSRLPPFEKRRSGVGRSQNIPFPGDGRSRQRFQRPKTECRRHLKQCNG